MAGVYQAVYWTSADQAVLDWLVKDSVSGRAEAVIKLSLGLVTWSLAWTTPFGACCLDFNIILWDNECYDMPTRSVFQTKVIPPDSGEFLAKKWQQPKGIAPPSSPSFPGGKSWGVGGGRFVKVQCPCLKAGQYQRTFDIPELLLKLGWGIVAISWQFNFFLDLAFPRLSSLMVIIPERNLPINLLHTILRIPAPVS